MEAEDLGGVGGERAVHEDRQFGQPAVANQLTEIVDHGLRPAQAEGGHNHFAAAVDSSLDDVAESAGKRLNRLVDLAAVGAFRDQQLAGRHRGRITEDRQTAAAEVAGEGDLVGAAGPVDRQRHHRRTEEMAGLHEADLHAGTEAVGPVIGH